MLSTVILLLHFATPNEEPLAMQMQAELDAVFALSPVRAQVRVDSEEGDQGTPDHVVFVNLNRGCRPVLGKSAGALALTRSVDGVIQPLIEIDCAKVATFIHSTSSLPRALARVLAHELLHYLLQEPGHTHDGIFRASLSSSDLTGPIPPSVSIELLQHSKLADAY